MIALLITLVLTFTTDGLQVVVQSDTPAQVYIQVDNAEPTIRLCNLGAGEACGFTAHAGSLTSYMRVRVWDGSTDPSADQIVIPPAPHRTYVPLF